jgi:hypothetical protein
MPLPNHYGILVLLRQRSQQGNIVGSSLRLILSGKAIFPCLDFPLIKRTFVLLYGGLIFSDDPLICPKCQGTMRISSSIEDGRLDTSLSSSSVAHPSSFGHYSIDTQDRFSYDYIHHKKEVLIKREETFLKVSVETSRTFINS